jgi:transposase
MEAVLAAQPILRIRGIFSDSCGMQRDGAFDTVLR